jgi:TnpA family transposase
MPVDFLSDEQAKNYGCFTGEPTPEQLARFFYLHDADLAAIAKRRGDHNRLGYAMQLCTVRFLGTFLSNPVDVPEGVIMHLASQLSISDPGCVSQYTDRPATHREHASEIRLQHGYRDFNDQPEHLRLIRWMYTRAWLTSERPTVMFDMVTARLIERKTLLPGVTALTRLVAQVRERATTRLWRRLAALPDKGQTERLEALLLVPEGGRISALDRLCRTPNRISSPALLEALERVTEIRAFGVSALDLSRFPAGRIKTIARNTATAWAQTLARLQPTRRIASLLVFAHVYEAVSQDDALELFSQLIVQCLARAEEKGQDIRLRTLRDLDAAAIRLKDVVKVVIDPLCADRQVRATIFGQNGPDELEEAVAIVEALTRPPEDKYYEYLLDNYSTIRRFLPTFLDKVQFQGGKAGEPVLRAFAFLKEIEGQAKPPMDSAPREIIRRSWQRLVVQSDGGIDRRFYTFCTLAGLQDSLVRRDVFVHPSERWGNPRARLLQGQRWETARPAVCRMLDLQPTAEPALETLTKQLDLSYQRVAERFTSNAGARIEQVNGKDRLVVTGLDKLDEPASLIETKKRVHELLPKTEITDAILEINGFTGFCDEFTHVSESHARVENLGLSICAVLTSQACNIGLEPMVDPTNPALSLRRLQWVQQNYIRAETLVRANARLVDAQARIPLARAFGGGEVASADGLRFVVPVRTLNAGPNSKYFHTGRGVTYYNFSSDQFTGFHGIVIPGTLHDSPYVLDGLLENETSLVPKELMTDTAGYSDLVFGLFWLLGYQFSPRLADLGESRFWRINRAANYGALDGLARQRINTKLIAQNWDDFLRVAGSLKMGTISGSELIRSLQRGSKKSMLARAIGELGRIPKTLHLLAYIEDENFRRRILTQLNRGEGRHSLARKCFFGQRGELRQHYREGQEDQLGALGLVVNALILWNTRYMDAALNHLKSQGFEPKPEDLARLSPLRSRHFNVLGRYHFTVTDSVLKGEMRPLRSPAGLYEADDFLDDDT